MKRHIYSVGLVLVVLVLGVALVNAAPLDVKNSETVRVLGEMLEDYSISYTVDVSGFINITNAGSDDIMDLWVAVDLNNNATGLSLYFENASSDVFIYTDPAVAVEATSGNIVTAGADYFVNVPLLKSGETVSLYYDVDDTTVGVPILIYENFNITKLPANKVQTWRVFLNLSLNLSALPTGAGNVYVNVTKYLSNDTANFGSVNWSVLGPIANPSTNKGTATIIDGAYTSNTQDALKVENILLNSTSPYVNISFDVTGRNDNVYRNATLEPFGFVVVFFKFNGTMSGTKIVDVFASAPAQLSAEKEGPVNNASGMWWNESVTIENTAVGVAYVIKNVTLWAVNSTAGFPDMSAVIPGSYKVFEPNVVLYPATSGLTPTAWSSGKYAFKNDVVPVVWANMTLKLIEDPVYGYWIENTTVHAYNTSYGSSYIVVEKILVIGTYLIKATKHVIPNATSPNLYDIYIVVENIGAERSPYVWAYDMVPENFTVVNFMLVNKSEMLSVNNGNSQFMWTYNVSNPMSGYIEGYAWALNPLEPNADGDGNYTDYTEIENNQTVVIYYQINGTGVYRVAEAFIVGIDPTFSMNIQTTPKITIVSGSAARNYEGIFAASIVAVLVSAVIIRNGRKQQ